MRPSLYAIYIFIISLLLLLLIGAGVFVLSQDYDLLVSSIVAHMHKNGLEQKIRQQLFTREHFLFLQHASWFVFILAPVCFLLALRGRIKIIGYCVFIAKSIRQCTLDVLQIFRENTRNQNRALLVLFAAIVGFFLYMIIASLISYDEQWCYNYYTDTPFYYSFFTYSSYPLFELSTHLFKWFPFSMQVNLRLSPFIFGIASCILLYSFLRKYFNSHFIGMAGMAAFALMPLSIRYVALAKGVMHELFFALAGICCLLLWLEKPAQKKYMAIYAIAGILGLYSMVTHLLLLLLLLLIALILLIKRNPPAAFLFVKINAFIFIVFFVAYMPIFLSSGLAVFRNEAGKIRSYLEIIRRMPAVVQGILTDFTGMPAGMVILPAIILLLLFFRNRLAAKFQFMLLLSTALAVSPIFFYLLTGFAYAGRSLAFCALAIPFLAALFLQMVQSWLQKNIVLRNSIATGAIILFAVLDIYFLMPAHPVDNSVARLSEILIQKNARSCYDNSNPDSGFFYYYPGIEYYYRLKKKNMTFTLAEKNSMRYKPLLPGDEYDCLVYDAGSVDSSRMRSYHEIYRDPAAKFTVWMSNRLK